MNAVASADGAVQTPMGGPARSLFEQAQKLYDAQDYAQARTLLEQICAAPPGYADAYHMLGVVLHDAGLFSKAQAAFERALQINPRYTEAALGLSVLYNDLGKYAEARDTYSQALAYCRAEQHGHDPFVIGKLANMHADLATAYRNAGMLEGEEAARHWQRALEQEPQNRLAAMYLRMLQADGGL
ncbi:MAG: tetratricopeptide repeat protein [Deltaproteobacteria bacterium]|nr:MAG: tetratricopeptide repeat protein [Deltaproteobacteria bacterium]